jgi:putative transposase
VKIILMGIRWYLAYPLSTRHVEELMAERGVELDHATTNRWVIKYSPLLEEAFHRRKRPVWTSWRIDETGLDHGVGHPSSLFSRPKRLRLRYI